MKNIFVVIFLTVLIFGSGCPDKNVDEYLRDLKSPNIVVKREAIHKIGELRIKEALPELVDLLDESSAGICVEVIRALGDLGDGGAVDPLIAQLDKNSPLVREKAIEALGKIRDKRAVAALASILERRHSRSDREVFTAVWALGNIGDKSAEPILISLLKEKDKYIRYNVEQALKNTPTGGTKLIETPHPRRRDKASQTKKAVRSSESSIREGEIGSVAASYVKTISHKVVNYVGRVYTWIDSAKTRTVNALRESKESHTTQSEEPVKSPQRNPPQSLKPHLTGEERIPKKSQKSSLAESEKRLATGQKIKRPPRTEPCRSQKGNKRGLLIREVKGRIESEAEIPQIEKTMRSSENEAKTRKSGDVPQPRWVVEVYSSISYKGPKDLASSLKKQGFPAYVSQVKLKGQEWYRVRVGPCLTEEDARETKGKIDKKFHITGSWVHLLYPEKARAMEVQSRGEKRLRPSLQKETWKREKMKESCVKHNNVLLGDLKAHAFVRVAYTPRSHIPTSESGRLSMAWLIDEMGSYIIHSVFPAQNGLAKETARRLQRSGYQVYIGKMGCPEKSSFHRMLIGGFKSRSTAVEAAKILREEYGLSVQTISTTDINW